MAVEIGPDQWWETWTNEYIFSSELCVAKQTLNRSDSSGYFSPITAKSKNLYSLRESHRPRRRSSPEKTALSVLLVSESASTYSRQVAGVRIGARGTSETLSSTLALYWLLQSPLWSSRTVRNTLDSVRANTLAILRFQSRHACEVKKKGSVGKYLALSRYKF